jgi:hypothetical protein
VDELLKAGLSNDGQLSWLSASYDRRVPQRAPDVRRAPEGIDTRGSAASMRFRHGDHGCVMAPGRTPAATDRGAWGIR